MAVRDLSLRVKKGERQCWVLAARPVDVGVGRQLLTVLLGHQTGESLEGHGRLLGGLDDAVDEPGRDPAGLAGKDERAPDNDRTVASRRCREEGVGA